MSIRSGYLWESEYTFVSGTRSNISLTLAYDRAAGDNPMLPVHPTHGRLMDVIAGSARRTELDQIVCTVYTVDRRGVDSELDRWRRTTSSARTILRKGDGLVNFRSVNGAWSLDGEEVESYKCS